METGNFLKPVLTAGLQTKVVLNFNIAFFYILQPST
jgi:hypothetical protein